MLQTVVSSSYHTLLWDGSLGFSVVPAKVWPLKATPLIIPAICRYSYVIPEFGCGDPLLLAGLLAREFSSV